MSAPKPRVLFVLTSHSVLGATGKPTGWYLPEFAHPYHELRELADITVASPAGGEAPLDPGSVESWKQDDVSTQFLENQSSLWKDTHKLESLLGKAKDFAAIFYVGGHGREYTAFSSLPMPLAEESEAMFDLATDATSIRLIREFFEEGKVVAAVCHGPAALVNVKLSNGNYLVADAEVTGFSNAEEDVVGLSQFMPFMLETELDKHSNGRYRKADKPWAECVVVAKGGRLITGQNPLSATATGKAIANAITKT